MMTRADVVQNLLAHRARLVVRQEFLVDAPLGRSRKGRSVEIAAVQNELSQIDATLRNFGHVPPAPVRARRTQERSSMSHPPRHHGLTAASFRARLISNAMGAQSKANAELKALVKARGRILYELASANHQMSTVSELIQIQPGFGSNDWVEAQVNRLESLNREKFRLDQQVEDCRQDLRVALSQIQWYESGSMSRRSAAQPQSRPHPQHD